MKQLKFKNYHLVANPIVGILGLYDWLGRQQLHGKESRMRTRFMKLLETRITEIEPERIKLCEEFCEKKDGKLVYWTNKKDKKGEDVVDLKTGNHIQEETTDKEKSVGYKIVDVDKFNKAYFDYLQEEFIIDITPANSEAIYGARDIILNTTEQFTGRQAVIYNEWCDCFEEVK